MVKLWTPTPMSAHTTWLGVHWSWECITRAFRVAWAARTLDMMWSWTVGPRQWFGAGQEKPYRYIGKALHYILTWFCTARILGSKMYCMLILRDYASGAHLMLECTARTIDAIMCRSRTWYDYALHAHLKHVQLAHLTWLRTHLPWFARKHVFDMIMYRLRNWLGYASHACLTWLRIAGTWHDYASPTLDMIMYRARTWHDYASRTLDMIMHRPHLTWLCIVRVLDMIMHRAHLT